MKIVSVSHKRLPNLGDRICRPNLYFPIPVEAEVDWGEVPEADAYVVGGGGLIPAWMDRVTHRPTVAWGTGWVYREWGYFSRPDVTVYGSRDWGQPEADAWVPCASCMHEALDREYEVTREIVGYWNPDFPQPKIDVPFLLNTAEADEVFPWLGRAETVLTNSYHGAYWAVLLGKKVVVVNAYSGKFTHFHPDMQPVVARENSWQWAEPRPCQGALELCRQANRDFFASVAWDTLGA